MHFNYERFATADHQGQEAISCNKLIFSGKKKHTVQSTTDNVLKKHDLLQVTKVTRKILMTY